MAWLLVLALLLGVTAVGFAAGVTFVVVRDRRRRRSSHVHPVTPPTETLGQTEINEAADCVQLWLDDEWDRKFGRGLTDSSGSIEG